MAYEADPNPSFAYIPPSALENYAKRRLERELAEYLMMEVKESAVCSNPPRQYFLKVRANEWKAGNSRVLAAEFRLRTGHCRLNQHLFRLKMIKEKKCRFCKETSEDGYHILLRCTELPGITTVEAARREIIIANRKQYNKWLFSSKNTEQAGRRQLIKTVLNAGIKI